jgi:1-acyl-sn-glycerol-3-phosphate acyltransferase
VLPPRWVRRVVLAPGMVLLTVAVLVSLPVLLLVAALASPVLPGRWRALRVGWMVVLHLLLETAVLITLFVLWVASGFGAAIRSPRFERAHYDVVQAYLRVMFAEAQRVLHVEVSVEGPGPPSLDGRPLLVFSRHAGPADSFMLVHALVSSRDREPRVVLKDTLQWDPAIDVLLNRLPNRFIRPGGGSGPVRELASGLDADDALVLFPEGGNFTARRRARSIVRLRRQGRVAEADRAEQLRHVLPPRPAGVMAALAQAPGADVVWVAHSGLDHLVSVADVWRALPMDSVVRMRWWLVPSAEVPHGEPAQIAWLDDWWTRIDDWIGAQDDAAL